MKYYFQEQDENCYTKQYHLRYMNENGLNELKLYEAKVERGTGMFFCKEVEEVGQIGQCSKLECKNYSPRNKKSGICVHYGYVYDKGEKIILKIK